MLVLYILHYSLQNDTDLVLAMNYLHKNADGFYSTLFNLTAAGKYHFYNEISYMNDPEYPVKCLYIKHSPLETPDLLSYLVVALLNNGTMEKCGVTLLSMGNDVLTYQINGEYYGVFCSMIERVFLSKIKEAGTRGLIYSQ